MPAPRTISRSWTPAWPSWRRASRCDVEPGGGGGGGSHWGGRRVSAAGGGGGPPPPVGVEFPSRGEWVAVRPPAHKAPSHGTELFGQRYAFDFVRPDGRNGLHLQPAGTVRSFLLGGRTRDYYGWGQPVHAAFDGRVVAAVDGVAERARVQVVREVALALRTTVGVAPASSGFEPAAGNT